MLVVGRDGDGLLLLGDASANTAVARKLGRSAVPGRHARVMFSAAAARQTDSSYRRRGCHDALDRRFRIRRRPTTRMPADCMPRVAALQWPASVRHQALGHRSSALVGVGHRLDDRLAGQCCPAPEASSRDVAGVAAEVHRVGRVVIAIDHTLAGVHRRASLRVDHRHLPGVAARILVGDPLHDLGGAQALLEQRDRLRSVRPVRRGLRGDGADARLGERHGRTGRERARLDADAELLRGRIERDDREGREPRVLLRGTRRGEEQERRDRISCASFLRLLG